jgi:putative membrane protein
LKKPNRIPVELRVLLAATVFLFVALGISPKTDRLTWLMENFPVMFGVPILLFTYGRFPLTPLAYRLIFLHALILMVGGHYSYAQVPLGHWIRRTWGLSRNHYDRLGHFAQGFVPAVLVREFLARKSPLHSGALMNFLVVSVCLAISACYEFIEWWTALASGEAATAFLGTQGDPWDTQWDMFLALAGATISVALLSRVHDRQLARIFATKPRSHEDLQ